VFALGPTLVKDPIRFRVSALLDDREDDPSQPSAIPVVLTLLFLRDWLSGGNGLLLEPSRNLTGPAINPCETDFVVVSYGARPTVHTHMLVGECKGLGQIDAGDLQKLGAVVGVIRSSGLAADLVLATTRDSFTDEELELCRAYFESSSEHAALRRTPILLTSTDLAKGPYERAGETRDYKFEGVNGLVRYSRDNYFS
jgi:hypothetical protein